MKISGSAICSAKVRDIGLVDEKPTIRELKQPDGSVELVIEIPTIQTKTNEETK